MTLRSEPSFSEGKGGACRSNRTVDSRGKRWCLAAKWPSLLLDDRPFGETAGLVSTSNQHPDPWYRTAAIAQCQWCKRQLECAVNGAVLSHCNVIPKSSIVFAKLSVATYEQRRPLSCLSCFKVSQLWSRWLPKTVVTVTEKSRLGGWKSVGIIANPISGVRGPSDPQSIFSRAVTPCDCEILVFMQCC